MITLDDIRERLSEIRPPGQSQDIVSLGMVAQLRCEQGRVTVHLQADDLPPQPLSATVAEIRRAVGALPDIADVQVHIGGGQRADTIPVGEMGPLSEVTDIVAVASAKGGVGKSTLAVNLACALMQIGQRVGILDADVYGPSVPTMLGISGHPRVVDHSTIFPLERYGLQVMSIGFFLDDSSPVIWRGPLVTGLIRQFLKDVRWHELDILVIDLPPGTGDAQLTLTQQVPLSGGIIVTTPQAVSLADVERSIGMFSQVNTAVLGVIENMSYYLCPKCGTREDLFGGGGGARLSRQFAVPLLGQIPLLPEVRISGDGGKPLVVGQPDHPVSGVFLGVATKVVESVTAERARAPVPRIIG